ncbi:hypothetical protein D3C80_2120730 [compost metagenome]
MDERYALLDVIGRGRRLTQQQLQLVFQRLEMRLKQAGLNARYQVLHRQKCVDLAGVEPQAWQLESLAS